MDDSLATGWDELMSYAVAQMNLKLCKVKENSHKGARAIECHFHEILEKTDLIDSDRKQACSCLCGRWWCWCCLEKGMGVGGFPGVMSTLHPLFLGGC